MQKKHSKNIYGVKEKTPANQQDIQNPSMKKKIYTQQKTHQSDLEKKRNKTPNKKNENSCAMGEQSLNELIIAAASASEETKKDLEYFLDYCASISNAQIIYRASGMQLMICSDAGKDTC